MVNVNREVKFFFLKILLFFFLARGGVRMDVNEEFKLFFLGGPGRGVWSGGGVGQGRCEQRSEVFMKNSITFFFFFFFFFFFLGGGQVGGGGGVRGGGGQGGCEQRIEFFVKIQKKIGGGVVGG